jgi:hypothetical protein
LRVQRPYDRPDGLGRVVHASDSDNPLLVALAPYLEALSITGQCLFVILAVLFSWLTYQLLRPKRAMERHPNDRFRALLDEAIAIEESEAKLRKDYAAKLTKMLPATKAARYLQIGKLEVPIVDDGFGVL